MTGLPESRDTEPSVELGRHAVRSGAAMAVRTAIVLAAGLARVSLVARALGPSELGVFALLLVAVEAARALTTLGPKSVLVQRASLTPDHIRTYWVFSVAQGALVALLVLAAYAVTRVVTPHEGRFHLYALVSLGVFVAAWESPGRLLAERDVRFTRVAAVESVVAIIDLAVVASLAYWLRSASALAIGLVIRAALEVTLSFVFFPTAVAFRTEPTIRREYLKAGTHLLLFTIGSYVTVYGDNAAIGALLGAQALGLYVVAYRLAEIPFSALFAVSKRLLFPVLSRLQARRERLTLVVLDTFSLQMMVLSVAGVGLCVFADTIIPLLFGTDYAEAVGVLRALVLLTLGRGMTIMLAQVLMSSGRYLQVSRLKWLEIMLFVPGVLFGIHVAGLVGAALGAGAGYVVAAGIRIYSISKDEGLPIVAVARTLATPVLVASAGGTISWTLRAYGANFLFALGVYMVTCMALLFLIEHQRLRRTVELVVSTVRNKDGT